MLSFEKTIFRFIKFLLKVVFSKDEFQLSPGGKTQSRQQIINEKSNQKSFFSKTIFMGKIVFEKDDFELVNFSNKLHKIYVWPKKIIINK